MERDKLCTKVIKLGLTFRQNGLTQNLPKIILVKLQLNIEEKLYLNWMDEWCVEKIYIKLNFC